MSVIESALQGKKVLVTGATGFVGGRLAQRLALEEGAIVTGTGRNLDAVPFLKDIVNMQRADLLNHADMMAVLEGQEVVFHVAAWLSRQQSEEAKAWRINVDMVGELVRMAKTAGVERFVHTSSVAAYGVPEGVMILDEEYPINPEQPVLYGRTKAAGEIEAFRVGKEVGLDVTAARPAMIYGPRSYSWSLGLFQLVQKRIPTLLGKADGHAYPIFIDNLIDGMLLMAVRPEAVNEAFNFCDPTVTWNEYFGYYGRMCGNRPIRIPMPIAHLMNKLNNVLPLGLPISDERIRHYQMYMDYPMDKAEKLLGYKQRVSVAEGMRQTEAWFRAEGYL